MNIISDWIKAIRATYKERPLNKVHQDLRIVTQLILKANRSISSSLPATIRNEWLSVKPRLLSLQRNLLRKKEKLENV